MQFLEELWKILGNIKILNLSQQKEEETIWCENEIIILKVFYRKLISNSNEKTEILMNKHVFLELSILELGKISMYEFWYDYVKPKYGEKAQLCYMFIVYINTDDIYKDIAEDDGTRFNISIYQLERSLPEGQNKRVIELMKY